MAEDPKPGKPKVYEINIKSQYMTKQGWKHSYNHTIYKDGKGNIVDWPINSD